MPCFGPSVSDSNRYAIGLATVNILNTINKQVAFALPQNRWNMPTPPGHYLHSTFPSHEFATILAAKLKKLKNDAVNPSYGFKFKNLTELQRRTISEWLAHYVINQATEKSRILSNTNDRTVSEDNLVAKIWVEALLDDAIIQRAIPHGANVRVITIG